MKKMKFLLTALLGMLLIGCSNIDSEDIADNNDGTDNKALRELTFTVDYFQEESGNTKSLTKASSIEHIKYIKFWLFDDLGDMLIDSKLFTGDEISTTLKLKVADGNYQIAVVASDYPIEDSIPKITQAYVNKYGYKYRMVKYSNMNADVFQGSIRCPINEHNNTLNYSVSLFREIGRVRLAFDDMDKIPVEVNTLIPVLYQRWTSTDGDDFEAAFKYYYTILTPANLYLSRKSDYERFGFPTDSTYTNTKISNYNSIKINKNDFSSYGTNNPITLYLPQTQYGLDFDYSNVDLLLIGTKDTEITYNTLRLSNPNTIFTKRLKKDFSIAPAQSITIKGSLFEDSTEDDNELNLTINEEWGETHNYEF